LLERPEAARRMGAMAHERARERFSADVFANSYAALYRRFAGSEK
jgi:glycosyltransferase involved in cell wall biosynthesis